MRLVYVRRVRRTTHQFHEKKKRKRREEKKKRRSFSGAGGRRERERDRERQREREKSGTKRTLARPHESLSLLSNLLESLVWERERETQKVKKDGA